MQHPRRAGHVREDAHQALGRNVEGFAKRQRLAHRLPEHLRQKVGGELHGGAGTDRANVLDATAQLLEDGPHSRDVRFLAPDESKQLALRRRPDGAAHRAIDEGAAAGADLAGQRAFRGRAHGAHLDEELARDVAREQAVVTKVYGRKGGGVGQEGHRNVRRCRHFPRRRHYLRARGRECARLVHGAVPHCNFVPEPQQARGDGRAHPAGAGHADSQVPPLIGFWLKNQEQELAADKRRWTPI